MALAPPPAPSPQRHVVGRSTLLGRTMTSKLLSLLFLCFLYGGDLRRGGWRRIWLNKIIISHHSHGKANRIQCAFGVVFRVVDYTNCVHIGKRRALTVHFCRCFKVHYGNKMTVVQFLFSAPIFLTFLHVYVL